MLKDETPAADKMLTKRYDDILCLQNDDLLIYDISRHPTKADN